MIGIAITVFHVINKAAIFTAVIAIRFKIAQVLSDVEYWEKAIPIGDAIHINDAEVGRFHDALIVFASDFKAYQDRNVGQDLTMLKAARSIGQGKFIAA